MKKFKKILSVALTGAILLGFSQITAVTESETKSVYLGGQPFGVKFYNNGVVIINLESYYDGNRYICPAKEGGLEAIEGTFLHKLFYIARMCYSSTPSAKQWCTLLLPRVDWSKPWTDAEILKELNLPADFL